MSKRRDVKPDTRLVTAGRRREWTQGLVNPAVWRASTILFDDIEAMKAAEPARDGSLHYGRNGTPTTWALCEAITELEEGAALTRLYPSGSAAVAAALLSVLSAGDELLMTDSAYGPTRAFAAAQMAGTSCTSNVWVPGLSRKMARVFSPTSSAMPAPIRGS